MRDAIWIKHYSVRAEEAYVHWIKETLLQKAVKAAIRAAGIDKPVCFMTTLGAEVPRSSR